jgi:hypothetical protein
VQSKFGGRSKIQKKPPVCHKSKLQSRKPPKPVKKYTAIIRAQGVTTFGTPIDRSIILTINQTSPTSSLYQGVASIAGIEFQAEIENPQEELGPTRVNVIVSDGDPFNAMVAELTGPAENAWPYRWGPANLLMALGSGSIELTILN